MAAVPQDSPASRVILLGASNLTRGIAAAMRQAQARLAGPLDVMFACGFGRSYGMRASLGPRDLPGITESALWPDLAARTPLPTFALLADVGNDLAYGASPKEIAGWLRECLTKLAMAKARAVLVQLPVETLEGMTAAQYKLLRHVYFSRQDDLGMATARERIKTLAAEVEILAAEFGAALVPQSPTWYRFDPIHYPVAKWNEVWSELVSSWGPPRRAPTLPSQQPLRWLYYRTRAPARRWFWGLEQTRAQPCVRFKDGSTVGFY